MPWGSCDPKSEKVIWSQKCCFRLWHHPVFSEIFLSFYFSFMKVAFLLLLKLLQWKLLVPSTKWMASPLTWPTLTMDVVAHVKSISTSIFLFSAFNLYDFLLDSFCLLPLSIGLSQGFILTFIFFSLRFSLTVWSTFTISTCLYMMFT